MARTLGRLLVTALVLGVVVASSPAQTGDSRAKPPSFAAGKGTDGVLFWAARDGVPTLVGVGATPAAPRRATARASSAAPSPALQSDLERWAAHWGPDAEPAPEPPRYERAPAEETRGIPLSWVYGGFGYPYAYPSYPLYPGYFHKHYPAPQFFPQYYRLPHTRNRINRFSRPYPRLPFRSAPGYPPRLGAPGLRHR